MFTLVLNLEIVTDHGLIDDDYEFLAPRRNNAQLNDDMREEVAQLVVASRDPALPAITEEEAMRCVPRDGVMWGKMTVVGERITASWAYREERYYRRANYVRVRLFYPQTYLMITTILLE